MKLHIVFKFCIGHCQVYAGTQVQNYPQLSQFFLNGLCFCQSERIMASIFWNTEYGRRIEEKPKETHDNYSF